MKVSEHLSKATKTLFSLEILPPLKGEHFDSIITNLNGLLEYKPSFIDVTYHQQEVIYLDLPDGTAEKHTVRKRPGTVGIAAALQYKTDIDVVTHLICGGMSIEETENILIDLHFLGLDNLLLLRGDPPHSQRYFKPEANGHSHALGLVKQVNNMNKGVYLDENLQNNHTTNFSIGVAGYPEKHNEAPNLEIDIAFLKQKVEAGAEYIVTQMFFENQKYFDFVRRCREAGITVPIIPGLKPLSTIKQLTLLPQTFHVNLPQTLVKEALKCKNNADVRQLGIEWAIEQSKELIAHNVPCLHFYTMSRADNIENIIKKIF